MHAPRVVMVERFGNLLLPLDTKNKTGYKRVRGKQGRERKQFQGYTPKKTHTTKCFDSAHEAAVALATLESDKAMGLELTKAKRPRAKSSADSGAHIVSNLAQARTHASPLINILLCGVCVRCQAMSQRRSSGTRLTQS